MWPGLGHREQHLIAERLHRQGFSEDARPDDPRRLLTVPNTQGGYPQLNIQDPDGHLIEINAARLDE